MERVGFYPERISPDSEQFQHDIETLHAPPEFELTEDERAEVADFEHTLARGMVPDGIESDITPPERGLEDISNTSIISEKICLDYFVQDEVFSNYFTEQGLNREQKFDRVRRMLSNKSGAGTIDIPKEVIDDSKKHERAMYRENIQKLINGEQYDGDNEPTIFRVVKSTEDLADKVEGLRQIKAFYKRIGADPGLEGDSHVAEAKRLMLRLHRERVNEMLAGLYADGITALEMAHHRTENPDDSSFDRIAKGLPGLAGHHPESMAEAAHFMPAELVGRVVSMIDKFMRGVDRGVGYETPISSVLTQQVEQAQIYQGTDRPSYQDISEELIREKRVDAEQSKAFCESVLKQLDLLSSGANYNPDDTEPAADGKWRVVIDPRYRQTLGVDGERKVLFIPKEFNRTLNQLRPAGALPGGDHEITHLLQHENGERLGLGITDQKNTTARTNLWLETGAVLWEKVAQERLFGQLRTTNYTYLRALEERIRGGNVTQSIWAYIQQRSLEEPSKPITKHVSVSIGATLRLFAHGGEWTLGGKYWSNSSPLEYAEQKIIANNIPDNMRYLFYIGRVNLTTLAQLHRIGWLRREDMIIPDRLPSEMIEDEVRAFLTQSP